MTEPIREAAVVLDVWLSFQQKQRRIPGLAAGLIYEGKIIWEAYQGFADVAARQPVTEKTQFAIASNSKSFTATAIMLLAEDKKLQLDDKVSKHLPWFSGPGLEDITIRHLLMHASGVVRDGFEEFWSSNGPFPTMDQLKQWAARSAAIPPLTKFKYSNYGYGVLGAVVEQASGVPYDSFICKRVFEPLGLKSTVTDAKQATSLSKGYSRDVPGQKRAVLPTQSAAALNSATGFVSTVHDLLHYLAGLFGGKLVKEQSLRELSSMSWQNPTKANYDFGWERSDIEGSRVLSHSGGYPGFITGIGFSPEKKLGMVFLTNAMDGAGHVLLRNAFEAVLWLLKTHDGKTRDWDATRYAGVYETIWALEGFAPFGSRLLQFSPLTANPVIEGSTLEHKGGDEFLIDTSRYGYDEVGEPVRFEVKDGKAEYVITQAQRSVRFHT